ncbi:hypothetical protein [Roseicella frigidaeris]|uniref:Uncharacterized protein n=1 Tax=Roseicella frigidaeris TaxID=2230885 RepID=A0A327M1W2_9PROT|nr:hypothetical protein [Roseicella frigidaeris]RAI56133.1 hypothetical protein DOO78_22535 [Roseicella frigidaeris]
MTTSPPLPRDHPDTALPALTLPLFAGAALLVGLALLPGEAVFLGIVATATALGLNLATLRRQGAPGLPRLPLRPEH